MKPCSELKITSYRKGCKCDKCRTARNEAQKKYRKLHPGYVKKNNLRQFGLSLEQWESMLKEQNNKCLVCDLEETGSNQHGKMALAVDHDHVTGQVRGLLCHRCNRALGLLQDNPSRVKALLEYRSKFG